MYFLCWCWLLDQLLLSRIFPSFFLGFVKVYLRFLPEILPRFLHAWIFIRFLQEYLTFQNFFQRRFRYCTRSFFQNFSNVECCSNVFFLRVEFLRCLSDKGYTNTPVAPGILYPEKSISKNPRNNYGRKCWKNFCGNFVRINPERISWKNIRKKIP